MNTVQLNVQTVKPKQHNDPHIRATKCQFSLMYNSFNNFPMQYCSSEHLIRPTKRYTFIKLRLTFSKSHAVIKPPLTNILSNQGRYILS